MIVTNSHEEDQLLFRTHNAEFMQVLRNRNSRYMAAYINFLGPEFSQPAMFTLSELQSKLLHNQSLYDRTANSKWLDVKSQVQFQIDNNQYITEGSSEWQYRQNKEAKCAQFIWPDDGELAIREQEKQQLLSLLEN